MRKEIGVDIDAQCYRLIDTDTGLEIKDVIMADDETGEYIQSMRDKHGDIILSEDRTEILREKKKGNIKLKEIYW